MCIVDDCSWLGKKRAVSVATLWAFHLFGGIGSWLPRRKRLCHVDALPNLLLETASSVNSVSLSVFLTNPIAQDFSSQSLL